MMVWVSEELISREANVRVTPISRATWATGLPWTTTAATSFRLSAYRGRLFYLVWRASLLIVTSGGIDVVGFVSS
jgi:hypothetical protein